MIPNHFNSIKVRLELRDQKLLSDHLRFQFHKGAIRTPTVETSGARGSQFQFHKGAIRTLCLMLMLFYVKYFNSIKVRLEHSYPRPCTPLYYLFQFHKGAIRTVLPRCVAVLLVDFNSIKVRLELLLTCKIKYFD